MGKDGNQDSLVDLVHSFVDIDNLIQLAKNILPNEVNQGFSSVPP